MSKITFDHIAIIYNPNSTGDAPELAQRLRDSIKHSNAVKLKASLTPTDHAGHAEELAKEVSLTYSHPLIVSVSGDGGYNEVINGVMQAKQQSKLAHPIIAIIGAGNANDHKRVVRGDTPLIALIESAEPKPLDLLHISAKASGFSLSRYAHSYIGFGITPEVAVELNKHSLNLFQEIRIVVKSFTRYRPFTIEHNSQKREIDSLIFANINEMAKILRLHDERNVTDNKFEVVEFLHKGRIRLLTSLLYMAIRGLKNQPQYSHYVFKTFGSHPAQLDGEVVKLPKRTDVTIDSVPKAVDSLY